MRRIKLIATLLVIITCLTGCPDHKSEPQQSSSTPIGSISGKFSVSDYKQVYFSQGNLQYQASTGTWRFAEKQYDIIGYANENISQTYTGWIDLFGWGTGNNPTLTSENKEDYNNFVDWGINKIANGGNQNNLWRTMTKEEWEYLLSLRNNAENLRGAGRVNNLNGYIFLPDKWSTPDGYSFHPNAIEYKTNDFSRVGWQKMEEYGAIFLPAAGGRYNGTETQGGAIGYSGVYWSSTGNAWGLDFSEGYTSSFAFVFWVYPYVGHAVRLVQDVK